MTCFSWKLCGKKALGSEPENKGLCSTCNNGVFLKEMLQCHSRALSKNIDFTRQNKTLLNIIKSCKEMPADNDFECSEEDDKVYSYHEWLPLSVPEHKSKCVAKRKLFCISNDNSPKKATKKKNASCRKQSTNVRRRKCWAAYFWPSPNN